MANIGTTGDQIRTEKIGDEDEEGIDSSRENNRDNRSYYSINQQYHLYSDESFLNYPFCPLSC
jgi:hypothetical protein